jgi:uncharacterized protein with HEPN domain
MLPEHDLGYLNDICRYAARARSHIGDLSYAQFVADDTKTDAVVLCLIHLGEASKGLSPEARAEFSRFPWQSIIGMRNVLTHAYGRIDYERIWDVVMDQLPPLRDELQDYLSRIQ